MMNKDVMAHYHMFDYRARCVVVVTTDAVREAQRRHQLDPITTIAVGRALSCAALLGSNLKQNLQYVHCTFAGDGVLGKIYAECNGQGHLRGYSSPARLLDVLAPGEPVPESVGEATGHGRGLLTVIRGTPGEMTPYTAVAELANGEIATDIARYLTDSEQIPSAVGAGVKLSPTGEVLAAGGVLVQRLGGAQLEDAALSRLEERLATHLNLSERIATGQSVADVVKFLQGDEGGFGELMHRELKFQCTCSRERMAQSLAGLGEAQLRDIVQEVGKIEVRCHYCNETRLFKIDELLVH